MLYLILFHTKSNSVWGNDYFAISESTAATLGEMYESAASSYISNNLKKSCFNLDSIFKLSRYNNGDNGWKSLASDSVTALLSAYKDSNWIERVKGQVLPHSEGVFL